MSQSIQSAQAGNAMLSGRQKAMIPVASFTASGNIEKLKPALSKALEAGLTINEVKEILVQLYAYAGFPRSLNAINTLLEVLDKRKAEGKVDVVGRDASALPENYDSETYGNKIRNELVGADLTENKADYAQFAPVIDKYLKAHLFGDIFVRDVLSHEERELATISALAAMAGAEVQLAAHFNIALKAGLSRKQLDDFISVLNELVSKEAGERAKQVLGRMD